MCSRACSHDGSAAHTGQVGNLLWADFGLPIYGHMYFVNNETIKKNPS